MYTTDNALGLADDHIVFLPENLKVGVHVDLLEPLQKLQADARCAGFELAVASGYRSFERQQLIWDAKASGLRPVLSLAEKPIDIGQLPAKELIRAILRWSALPGGSRHHWGSEIDVFDAAALQKGRALQLTVHETQTLFAPFYAWLQEYLSSQPGFVRPYAQPGRVACEPWHLSFTSIAQHYEKRLTYPMLRQHLEGSNIALRETVLQDLEYLYCGYISSYFT